RATADHSRSLQSALPRYPLSNLLSDWPMLSANVTTYHLTASPPLFLLLSSSSLSLISPPPPISLSSSSLFPPPLSLSLSLSFSLSLSLFLSLCLSFSLSLSLSVSSRVHCSPFIPTVPVPCLFSGRTFSLIRHASDLVAYLPPLSQF